MRGVIFDPKIKNFVLALLVERPEIDRDQRQYPYLEQEQGTDTNMDGVEMDEPLVPGPTFC